ncbi:hypothetical protein [Anaerobacillus alkaliphilus]|uniref:hypothetical protein n=1 Tax=Anaerobacillus alkaliphilus TaxID=1548597 RepID=UPI0013761094|nr:hypothetical protein [Anaerobacillus alkaliphilus]
MKEKGLYIGIGILVGVGIGLLGFKKISVVNVGHLNTLTINSNRTDRQNEESKVK